MKTMDQIVVSHFTRTPSMQVQDVYKLLHQAAMGSEHAVSDEQVALEWLEREMNEMGDGPDDPLLDPISPDGQILRVHLRSFLSSRKNPQALLKAFIRTGNDWHGSIIKLKEYCTTVVQLAQSGLISIPPGEIEPILDKMQADGYPAVHHSTDYVRLYRPAYRVVARQFLEEK
jgi:hypothetical protein